MDQPSDDLPAIIAALTPVLTAAAREGGRLPAERTLSEMLGVPRRRLRLALDELQRRGTVFRRRGQGTFVTPPPPPDKGRHRLLAGKLTLGQLMDVRHQIEPRLAELAAIHSDDADIAQLEVLMRRSRDARTPQEYDLADEVFHYRIAELAGNALFLEFYAMIREMRREAGWRDRRAETNKPAVMRALGEQHQRIFDAIATRDVAGAATAQRIHMEFVAAAIQSG
ncbi:FCD domain-containing protein [uncultured Nitratireductor sp.]|uniref:FadR/GntR family transcriptional regulator n=1 Tax=uncultured Nitratireductor sp. TaxID=520953 RepID=UPI0025F348C4|nr:FCD domain-containing protein [uncultured Nitratireductor sp.]